MSLRLSSIKTRLSRFFKNESANVTIMAGLAVIPMFLAAGAAVDMVRINREQATFQAAVDSAVLAVAADSRSAIGGLSGQALADRISDLEDFAHEFINANYSAEQANAGEVTLNVTANNQAVQIMAHNQFPTTIMKMAGVDYVELDAFAEVKKAMRPIELVMVMDTTGSMAGSKMTGAKDAARTLMQTLYGGTLAQAPDSEYIRAALVPFAAGVRLNVGGFDFNQNWIDTTGLNPLSRLHFASPNTTAVPATLNNFTVWSQMRNSSTGAQMTWNGCVEGRTRTGGLNANDTAPSIVQPDSLFPAYFAPDTPTGMTNSDNEYIGTSGTPNERTNMTSGQSSSTTTAGYLLKQENFFKYANKSISPESTTSSNAGPWYNCAKTPIVPMTYNRANIEAGITAMTAAGNTVIAEGLAWGLRVVSPTQPYTQVEGSNTIPGSTISNYGDARWRKVMVLMTDGDNDVGVGVNSLNATRYSAYGRGAETLANNRYGTTSQSAMMPAVDADLLSTCTIIKNAGVELYVSSFGSGVSSATQTRLSNCATDPEHYQHANAPSDLVAFFDHIGQETLNKMIYVSK